MNADTIPEDRDTEKREDYQQLSPAQVTLERVLLQLPKHIRSDVVQLEEFPLEKQAKILRILQDTSPQPEQTLLEMDIAKKLLNPEYQHKDAYFIDPTVYLVERGHKVAIIYEAPINDGPNRHLARFLRKVAKDETGIVVDGTHPDIKALNIDWGTDVYSAKKNHDCQILLLRMRKKMMACKDYSICI